jgi:putative ABC transport system permease protein
MASIAVRNLLYDKVRLTVTLTGIIFAVVLVAVQTGLFLGFTTTTTNVIDNSRADFWVTSRNVDYIEAGVPFPEKELYHALPVPGVAEAQKYIVRFGILKKPDGANANCEIVGFDPERPFGGPWNVVEGDVRSLTLPDTVMIDRFYMKKLGVTHLGQTVEIRNIRARVMGFTEGIRTFTTSPLIFTSYKNAQNYSALDSNRTMYLLVKAAPGVDLVRLRASLQAAMDNVDVLPTGEFSRRTNFYWMFGTGAGLAVIVAAMLGLIVGIVVVAQTIYAATVDHIREFGTLKAMGATNGYIYRIILNQAVVSAIAGYAVAIVIASALEYSSRGGGANIVLPASVRVALFGLTLFMCVSAAMVSINKVTKIDPALVFKG